jgi:hypothetical protein
MNLTWPLYNTDQLHIHVNRVINLWIPQKTENLLSNRTPVSVSMGTTSMCV